MDLVRRGNFHYKLSSLLELALHCISQNLFLILLNFQKEFVQTCNPVKPDNASHLGNSFMGRRLKWEKGVEKGTKWSVENHGRIRGFPMSWNPKPHHRMFPNTPASREETARLWAGSVFPALQSCLQETNCVTLGEFPNFFVPLFSRPSNRDNSTRYLVALLAGWTEIVKTGKAQCWAAL